MKNNRVALISPHEKMPFQVTPLMPYVARYGTPSNPVIGAQNVTSEDEATGNAGAQGAPATTVPQLRDREVIRGTVAADRRNENPN